MSNSYPRRDQASGIWKLNQITKNIKDQGTYPQIGGAGKGFAAGGDGTSKIDVVTIKTAGNSTDFGDLTTSGSDCTSCRGNATRVIFVGATPASNVIQYITPASSGNAADYGDLTVARLMIGGGSNTTRAVNMGGQTPGGANVIDFMTIPTLGNATDFGDLTQSSRQIAGNCSTTRAFAMGGDNGGSPASALDRIEMVEISTTGNAIDFGNLIQATYSAPQGCGSFTRGLNAGGQTPTYLTTINSFNYGSLGNTVDFGDLTQARRLMAAFSDTQRGCWAGGIDPSANSNVIDFVTISSFGNATDFGDLTEAKDSPQSGSDSHQGIEALTPRAPELYSPTGTVVPRGLGTGQIGILAGGKLNPAGTNRNDIQFVNISTTGNSQLFGDLTSAKYGAGGGASSTRSLFMGGYTPAALTATDYFEFSSKGNAASFGDLTTARAFSSGCSNSTRSLMMGGNGPAPGFTRSNVVDYFTIASIGNASDFGDLTTATAAAGATANSTRAIVGGGTTGSDTNVIEYFTIGSTGNATDFGDLTVARQYPQGLASSTRGVFAGGYDNGASAYSNVIDYVTIASTGNALDFGDLTVARSQSYGGLSNNTRGVFLPGTNPDNVTMDYITIASTGNAIDFGDPAITGGDMTGTANGHGGLS